MAGLSARRVRLSRISKRRGRTHRSHGRARLRRPYRADRPWPAAHLQGACGLEQPAGPRAHRGLRREARQPRADPLGEQSRDDRLLARRDEGRRRRRQHHADAAGRGTDEDRRQGGDRLALCDTRILDELVACAKESRFLKSVVGFDGTANHDAELDRVALNKPVDFAAVRTGRDDVALLGFTSGTTGAPKATMHFHRDILIIADGYARQVLEVRPEDVFVGSPPIAFTFGLGGLAVFPLRFGASAVLIESATPPNLVKIIEAYKATVCFTAPTAYRAMLAAMDEGADLSSLRVAVSAGETLPAPVYEAWTKRTGVPILDGMGSTEMLHVFIGSRLDDRRPGVTGTPVPGYEAKIVDKDFNEVPRGTVGRLAVRGPTGCRYLADVRQREYVQNGWNVTGDAFSQDEEGYFHFAARNDDMIISAGYNIAGPEVEAALLTHEAVERMRGDRASR